MQRATILCGLLGLVLMASVAQAADRFGMISIYNHLNTTKKYSFHWEGHDWSQELIEPGQVKWHSVKIPQGARVPGAEIRFDSDLRDGELSVLKYNLQAEGAPAQAAQYGRPYKFVYDGTNRYVDLKQGN